MTKVWQKGSIGGLRNQGIKKKSNLASKARELQLGRSVGLTKSTKPNSNPGRLCSLSSLNPRRSPQGCTSDKCTRNIFHAFFVGRCLQGRNSHQVHRFNNTLCGVSYLHLKHTTIRFCDSDRVVIATSLCRQYARHVCMIFG